MSNWSGRLVQQARQTVAARGGPCIICGHPIDYTLTADDPDGFTVEHIHSRSQYPELIAEPSNWAAAHSRCNKAKGNRTNRPDIGSTTARL